MARTLYALLVGINDYPTDCKPPVPQLFGCANDVDAMEAYLRGRTDRSAVTLELKVFKNSEATRQNVILGWQEHLARAGKGDLAFFYYSGHGSQQACQEVFWQVEPDHLDETLVLYDSRLPGNWDLADKELAYLIKEVAKNGVQVTVVLDSCHSGSATRGDQPQTAVRWAPATHDPRPLESYVFPPGEVERLKQANDKAGWVDLPQGRHVLLSACQDSETAKETFADSKSWGGFSYYLRSILETANGPLSYRDVFKQVAARVRSSLEMQTPQLEAAFAADADAAFLDGAILPRPETFTLSAEGPFWRLDAGSIHGIPAPTGEETTTLAIFPLDAKVDDLRSVEKALATGSVGQVLPDHSLVVVENFGALDAKQTYRALVIGLPMPPTGVRLEGEEAGLAAARGAISTAAPGGKPSLFIREDPAAPELRLWAVDGRLAITRPGDDKPLVAWVQGYTEENARKIVRNLEQIARWTRLVELQNAGTNLPAQAVDFQLFDAAGQPHDLQDLAFTYTKEAGQWKKPSVTARLKNTLEDRTLYATLLDLDEAFSASVCFSLQPVVKLGPGEEFKSPIFFSVPNDRYQVGITEAKDILKLIVSTEPFDALAMQMDKLDAPQKGSVQRGIRGQRSSLSRLVDRLQTRSASDQDEDVIVADWVTSQVVVHTTRPLDTQALPPAGQDLTLGPGVTLHGHPGLTGRVRIAAVPPAARDLASPGLPDVLRQQTAESQPYAFRPMRGLGASENMLEISEVSKEDVAAVTPQSPLKLTVDAPLFDNQHVLAFGYDGEFFLPLGVARPLEGGRHEIELQRLPDPYGTRDLKGAVRILFQKFVAQPLGLNFPYPILAVASVGPDGSVLYQADPAQVAACVEAAERITVYVHGFTGDTRGMVASAASYLPGDLLLTFDYESVNTSVEKTARALKERLQDAGLKPGHSKHVRLVAHSLGGIVSRWFIEREGGNQIVEKLVILGSPSKGTPWPTYQQWATLGIGLALNGIAAVAWPVKALGVLVNAFEKIDVTLDEIQPNSELLETLNQSDDPHVPYVLIAGSTSLLEAAIQEAKERGEASKLGRLAGKLGYNVASLAFFNLPNDFVVGVESVHGVKLNRTPKPELVTLPCDHITYFVNDASLAALGKALG